MGKGSGNGTTRGDRRERLRGLLARGGAVIGIDLAEDKQALATELHCYIPEELDETWAHLRHLGRRRAQLTTAATASVQRIQDFLSVAWPVVTDQPPSTVGPCTRRSAPRCSTPPPRPRWDRKNGEPASSSSTF